MSVFDSLTAMMGGQGAATADGAPPSPEHVGALSDLLQSQGGLGGLLQGFERQGLGGAVGSWLGGGANQAVSPDQVSSVLGSGPLAGFAAKLGITPQMAAGQLSQLLPQLVDHLSPNGHLPADAAEPGAAGGLGASGGPAGGLGGLGGGLGGLLGGLLNR